MPCQHPQYIPSLPPCAPPPLLPPYTGSTYTDTCAPAYSPAGGDYGTWCPVDPQTCGGRTFDYCSLVPQQPPTDDPAAAANLCMPALVSACRGLIVRSNSTSNGAGGGGGGCYEISMPGHGCPAQLRVTDDCFLQIGLVRACLVHICS